MWYENDDILDEAKIVYKSCIEKIKGIINFKKYNESVEMHDDLILSTYDTILQTTLLCALGELENADRKDVLFIKDIAEYGDIMPFINNAYNLQLSWLMISEFDKETRYKIADMAHCEMENGCAWLVEQFIGNGSNEITLSVFEDIERSISSIIDIYAKESADIRTMGKAAADEELEYLFSRAWRAVAYGTGQNQGNNDNNFVNKKFYSAFRNNKMSYHVFQDNGSALYVVMDPTGGNDFSKSIPETFRVSGNSLYIDFKLIRFDFNLYNFISGLHIYSTQLCN